MLTPIALAHWITGDGKARPHGLILCTHSFTVPEVERLMDVLMVRYQLEVSLVPGPKACRAQGRGFPWSKQAPPTETKALQMDRGKYPLIYIKSSSMPLLRYVVLLYMDSSMLYKLGL